VHQNEKEGRKCEGGIGIMTNLRLEEFNNLFFFETSLMMSQTTMFPSIMSQSLYDSRTLLVTIK
jgi:hypothetical protein